MIMLSAPALIYSIDLSQLKSYQFTSIVDLVISLCNSNTPTLFLIKESLELLQLELGALSLIFLLPFC